MRNRLVSALVGVCLIAFWVGPNGLVAQATEVEARLKELGVTLPAPQKPIANYVSAVRTGNLVFLAGHGPAMPWDNTVTGKVGRDLTIEQAAQVARKVGINLLASLKAEIGDLNKVVRIVKVLGMVNSAPGFGDQPKVMNGFSDLMVQIFGERGRHARSAVGMAELPLNLSVEIEMVVEVQP